MNPVIDKCILLICLTVFFFGTPSFLFPVLLLIMGITIGGLNSYFDHKYFTCTVSILYLCFCLRFPYFVILLPLVLYDCFSKKLYPVMAAGSVFYLLFLLQNFGIESIALGSFLVLSFLLCYRTDKSLKLQRELKKMRDDSTELNLLLENKNKDLLEKQDYEIHLATLKERNRIAREIHDNVGHLLSRSILQAGALITLNKEEALSCNLLALKDSLSQAMDNIRCSVHNLHDESIDLYNSICSILKEYSCYTQHLEYDMKEPIPKNIKYCFIMVLKEGLSNILRHSNADRIEIMAVEHPSFYQFRLTDNGTLQKKNTNPGIGLENMQERVKALHGTFTLRRDNGFQIFISIPKNSSY